MCTSCVVTSDSIGGFSATIWSHGEQYIWVHCSCEGETILEGFSSSWADGIPQKHKCQWDSPDVTYTTVLPIIRNHVLDQIPLSSRPRPGWSRNFGNPVESRDDPDPVGSNPGTIPIPEKPPGWERDTTLILSEVCNRSCKFTSRFQHHAFFTYKSFFVPVLYYFVHIPL